MLHTYPLLRQKNLLIAVGSLQTLASQSLEQGCRLSVHLATKTETLP